MNARTPGDAAAVTALCEELAPYPWRRFTPVLMARFALAVRDRQELTVVLSGLHGAAVGNWDRLEPADRCDGRVAAVVGLITHLRWAEFSLVATCGLLAGGLGNDLR